MKRFLPAIVLVVMAPLIAELLTGSTPISQPLVLVILFLLYLPLYGAGALLIRELVRRSGRGWASILLLGAAYGFIEEGLVLQSLFHPTLYHAADWGARFLGINGVYTESVIGVHVVWSTVIPILLTELLFPDRRTKPYLGRFGLVVTGICYVFGVALFGLVARVSIVPGYSAPPILLLLAALAALVLVVIALVVLPRRTQLPRLQVNAPRPQVILLVIGIGAFVWQALLVMLWRIQPAFAQWPLVLLPMVGALVLAVVMIWLVRRWAQAYDWSDYHLLALASGTLVAHVLFGGLVLSHTMIDRVGVFVMGLVMIVLLFLFSIHVRQRTQTLAEGNVDMPAPESIR